MKKVLSLQSGQRQPEQPTARRLVKWHDAEIRCTQKQHDVIRKFVDARLTDIPRFIQRRLVEGYCKRHSSKTAKNPEYSANMYLRDATKPIKRILKSCPFQNLKALRRDAVLESEALICTQHCMTLVQSYESHDDLEYDEKIRYATYELTSYLADWGLEPPFNPKTATTEQREVAIVRMCSDKWWTRKLFKLRDQINEFIAIAAGYVRKGSQEYCSNVALADWRQQRRANQAYLESMEIVNEETEERFNLAEIAAATVANPEKRRIELMVRCRGLEELADDKGYSAFFVTWTAPSKYHRTSKKWANVNPAETQKYLVKQWSKCRAKINRDKIDWFGVRVAEPHADATPHWHMLVFCHPHQIGDMQYIMESYALEHDADEKGAQENRFQIEEIDPSKGSATGYIAKYISKNINANHVEDESDHETDKPLSEGADRVGAWASRWRIRQFQFFGAAAVSIWRECRRIDEPLECPILESVRMAADNSRWSEFTKLLDQQKGEDNPVSLLYDSDKINDYGEEVKTIVGLACAEFQQITRTDSFRLERKQSFRSGSCSLSGDNRAPWSTVNNCTELPGRVDDIRKSLGLDTFLASRLAAGAGIIDRGVGYKIINGEIRQFSPHELPKRMRKSPI